MNARSTLSNGLRLAAAGLTAALLAACGGHSGGGSLPATPSNAARSVTVSFNIVIPSATSASAARIPNYVSASTHTANVSVSPVGDGSGSVTAGCTATACSGTISAPAGSDVFTVSLFDNASTPNLLSKGVVTQTIVAGQANTVNVTFDPVVATVTFGAVSFTAGTAVSGTALPIVAKDAASNTIIGPGVFIDKAGTKLTIGATVANDAPATAPGHVTVTGTATGPDVPGPTQSAVYSLHANIDTGNIYSATLTPTVTPSTPNVTATAAKVAINPAVTSYAATGSVPGGIFSDGTKLWFGGRAGNNSVDSITTAGTITPVSAGGTASPFYGVVGSDLNYWFSDWGTAGTANQPTPARILKVDHTSSVLTPYTLTNTNAVPVKLALGSDNNVWFTERGYVTGATPPTVSVSGLGKITPAGVVTEFDLTAKSPSAHPYGIVAVGTKLWFTEDYDDAIGYWDLNAATQTVAGAVTIITMNSSATANQFADANKGITYRAADTTLWWCRQSSNQIAKINADGTGLTFYLLPGTPQPTNIIVAADGRLWFTESNTNKLGVIDPANAGLAPATGPLYDSPIVSAGFTELTLPTTAQPVDLATGPDGNVWVTDASGNILKVTAF